MEVNLSTLCREKVLTKGMTWLWDQGVRGTWQGRTIELRLEGRLLCLGAAGWGGLPGEGRTQFSPLD